MTRGPVQGYEVHNLLQLRFTPGLAFGEKDIGHLAITEYLSLTGQGKLRNRKIISERKQIFIEILKVIFSRHWLNTDRFLDAQ
jgi:hypothetical protein